MRRASRSLPRAGSAGLVALCLLASGFTSAPALAAPQRVPGIDVSMWQGDVDWTAVASTPVRFVIMRATRGHDYVDPRYAEYLAEASGNGLVVGAYHRAKPGLAEGDAEAEADHFLDVARNAAGDVLPVLDIEERGVLTVAQLNDWVRAWVVRVFKRTGVRAMLYASPYFWRTNMGDTRWFADRGYPSWIAHWGVATPDVPAQNWGGRGWTYWQWTSTGSVSGIAGDVDRDRFNGSTLGRGRIASLTVTPAAGGVITGVRIACGGGNIRCNRLANPDTALTLTATPGPGAALLGWTGACSSAGASPTCAVNALGNKTVSAIFGYPVEVERRGTGAGTVTSSPAGMDCGAACTAWFPVGSSVTLTAAPDSASAFASWGDGCTGTDPDCTVAVSSPTRVVATFASVVTVEQDGAGTGYAWGRAIDARAIGGSYRWERRAFASAEFAFSGGAVTLFTVSGPSMGRARVAVDGTTVGTFDAYAPTFRFKEEHRFDGLGAGAHTLEVTVLGTKRPVSAGTRVGIDALRWGGVLRPSPKASARWATVSDPSASGGTYVISEVRESFARFAFQGTGVSLGTLRGPAMGRADVWLDGAFLRTVDLYAPTAGSASVRIVSGLTDGVHVARVVVSGSHRPASTGSAVAVDRWSVI